MFSRSDLPLQWICPHCFAPQIVTDGNLSSNFAAYALPDEDLGIRTSAIKCLNVACNQITLDVALVRTYVDSGRRYPSSEHRNDWRLLPESSAKPQPAYIPKALVADYTEACRIRDLSPKASATLARRCLQGMIRHFGHINEKTLYSEIRKLREAVDAGTAPRGVTPESVDAIDHVRTIGNIGAHMEADVNLIVDIEPGEAQTLIELIESLFEEWYVAQHVREARFAHLAAMAQQKKEQLSPLSEMQSLAELGKGQS
jgi:hypothetical protein